MVKMASYLAIACMVVLLLDMAPRGTEGAVTCGGVSKTLAPCIAYLKGAGGVPPANCCVGVRTLKGMARTTVDRKTACQCMKTAASRIKGMNYGTAARLPAQCRVSIAYTLSPNTNCNTVQ